ncbi:hypothetical protein POM88_024456 [Heracleum sosnowskyi]|uniref:F-box domain-containing protein n=1 Tax=Heracleum sosnowskyi TaxID=360622 RepID=A0AAD8I452_9APIA|nr:hypothetical protein POM88_024456 [Heracleum sosnowskyi]
MKSSSNCSSTSGDMLTEDLIYEILLRLPVKSLLCFKAVSKYWCSLIRSPSFIKSHLSITRPGDDETLIVVEHHDDLSFSLLHLGCCKIAADLKSPFSEGELPSRDPYVEIVGSANGIVCVSSCDVQFSFLKCTYLWNPATKEKKLIPPHTTPDGKQNYNVPSGIGFDPIDNDFKVVTHNHDAVYSANMNAWRAIPSNSVISSLRISFGVWVDRFLCWTTIRGGFTALDLNKEVFNFFTELPNRFKYGHIAKFNNSIVVINNEDEGYNKRGGEFSLWMLDDVECLSGGGAEASWTPMLTVNVDVRITVLYAQQYFNTGNLLISCGGSWYLYNTDTKENKKLPVSETWGHIFMYKESLVSIAGFKHVECS